MLAHSCPDHASRHVGTYTACLTRKGVAVERNRSKVLEVAGGGARYKFGRGRGCVLLAVLRDGTLTVTSVLTHAVVARHACPADTADFFLDDTWLVVVDGAAGASLFALGAVGQPPASLCSASNVQDVCFTDRYVVLIERGDVVWVADTAALDHATIVAVRFTIVPYAKPVVSSSPGFERYKQTALFGDPSTGPASKAAARCCSRAPVAAHGVGRTDADGSVVYTAAVVGTRDLCTVTIDPHALLFGTGGAATVVAYAWPRALTARVPVVGTLSSAAGGGRVIILYTAEATHTLSTDQYALVADGARVFNIKLTVPCVAAVVGREGKPVLLKPDGAYFTPDLTVGVSVV